jgi:hypothetical protein
LRIRIQYKCIFINDRLQARLEAYGSRNTGPAAKKHVQAS